MESLSEQLIAAAAVGGFLGGLLAQLAVGAFYLRKIVRHRCTNHARRLEQLEAAWVRHAVVPAGGRNG